MKVGTAIKKINPEIGCQMEGYTPRNSTGQHDDLTVSVLAINHDFLIISVDLIALPGYRVDRIKRKIQNDFAIDPQQIIISAVHTHSGPTVTDLLIDYPKIDEKYWSQIDTQVILAVKEAFLNLTASELKLIQYQVADGIYCNRNNKNFPYNKNIFELRFSDDHGILASYLLVASHPTVMNFKNTLLSADLIHEIRSRYEEVNGVTPVVALSDCGDTSTRFTRQESSFREIKRLGSLIKATLKKPVYTKEINWSLKSIKAIKQRCDYNPVTDKKVKLIYNICRTEYKTDIETQKHLLDTYQHVLYYGHTHFETQAYVYDFDNFRIVTYPGELVYNLGNKIRTYDKKPTLLVTLANDYRGYSVGKSEFGKYFESYNSVFLIGMADQFVNNIIATF